MAHVEVFYRGLGRPQGLAFDVDGNLYVAASLHGRRGIVKITPDRKASLAVSGQNLVGLAFAPVEVCRAGHQQRPAIILTGASPGAR